MLDFIVKYWLQFLFGLIVTGLSIALKKVWKMYKNAQMAQHNQEKKELLEEMDVKIEQQNQRMVEADNEIKQEIHNIEGSISTIGQGVLSIQGENFRDMCRKLLEPAHFITIEEYEQIVKEHDVYKSLGGNHTGDKLFEQVELKFSKQAKE